MDPLLFHKLTTQLKQGLLLERLIELKFQQLTGLEKEKQAILLE
jgi:hypothetical protein